VTWSNEAVSMIVDANEKISFFFFVSEAIALS
jgi:hypothetical protein